MKYFKRILGLPFFVLLNLIGLVFHLFKISKLFILYGGEVMAYDKKTSPKMIADIYYQLEKNHLKECISNDVKIVCDKCNNTENFHFNYDYAKKNMVIDDVLCNECGHVFEL